MSRASRTTPKGPPVVLGPFELFEVVGRGGMGEVWRGVHREQQVPVAVKVVTRAQARTEHFLQLFHREIQTIAGLDHPNIVMVLDYGEVSEDAARQTQGRMVAGSPYLAMELAEGGSLRQRLGGPPMMWSAVKALVEVLLDALGHAHARGVIHRDLKPDNVLRCHDDRNPDHTAWRLTDFGIAHALDRFRAGRVEQTSGTPSYMAPEQIVGRWRDYGPWTDLYALGCLVHQLVSGALPYEGQTTREVADGHLWRQLPALRPRIRIPVGFEGWLTRLLVKEPEARFQYAADAAWALASLPHVEDGLFDGAQAAASPAAHDAPTLAPGVAHVDAEASEGDRLGLAREPAPVALPAQRRFARVGALKDAPSGALEPEALARAAAAGPRDTPPLPPRSAASVKARSPEVAEALAKAAEVGSDNRLQAVDRTRATRVLDTQPPPAPVWNLRETSSSHPNPIGAPPLPAGWRRDRATRAKTLLGAGLGLYGLRAVPLVGRVRERDALWAALRGVIDTHSAAVVALQGSAGTGKSRLAEWLCERAHEVGAAQNMRAFHSPMGGPSDGLGQMVARLLRCVGLGRAEARLHIRELLSAWGLPIGWEVEGLVELAIPEAQVRATAPELRAAPPQGDDAPPPPRDSRPSRLLKTSAERVSLVVRLLQMLGRRRPMIVWLDDVQWGGEALELVRLLQQRQRQRPSPVLVVLTIQDEALVERPQAAHLLSEILTAPRAQRLRMEPLASEERAELVRELLGLEASLAAQVSERTGGNPLFAVQLLGDWVQRDLLEVGRDGFVLKNTAEALLPDDLHLVWSDRVERLLEGRQHADRLALELAATLGQAIHGAEWRAACREAHVYPSASLVSVLVSRRLARWTGQDGWVFVHSMLRESLERMAADAGRLAQHHWVCAQMLQRRYRLGSAVAIAERLGRHLIEAGDALAALEPLRQAAEERLRRGEHAVAQAILDRHDASIEQLGLDAHHQARLNGLLIRSKVAQRQNQLDRALRLAQRLERHARERGHVELQAQATLEQARLATTMGQYDRACTLHASAAPLFVACASERGLAYNQLHLGRALIRRGDLVGAHACFTNALECFERVRDSDGACRSRQGLAELAWMQGDTEQAMALYEATLAESTRRNNRFLMISSLNGLAEVDRTLKNHSQALDRYLQLLDLSDAVGDGQSWIIRVNMALLYIAEQRYVEARAELESILPALEASGRGALLGGVHAELLPCTAALRDWTAFDRHMNMARTLLSMSGAADPDDAWPAQLAGDLAAAADMPLRAERAYNLALSLWSSLGNDAKVREVEAALEGLDFT